MTNGAALGGLLLGSYLLGSIPFAFIVAKWGYGIDIRTVGSGNVGATNVGRTCGKKAGYLVFVLDVIKGVIPPLVGAAFGFASYWQILMAFLAMMGHVFPVWLRFKGGKGVATGLGALLGIMPLVGLIGFAIYGLTMKLSQIVSVGSICAILSLPILTLVFYPHDPARLAFTVVAGIVGLVRHRTNIQRLLAGTESKLNRTKPAPEATKDEETVDTH